MQLLERAVEALETSPSRLELARALIDLGALTATAGRRADARGHLSRGLEMAQSFGAVTLAERALHELARTGARPRRLAVTGPSSLTPAERRVAELAAGGEGNREIAQMLFVSIKAVEYHMGNVLKKLGLASRDSLRQVLHDGGSSAPCPSRPEPDRRGLKSRSCSAPALRWRHQPVPLDTNPAALVPAMWPQTSAIPSVVPPPK
ncbi:MAG TPA: LuxR C-terminal-related transcriptional regulator [Acidimicrobiales bacterium]|nr:LuxR C-terminal-related transcriptional regulator [Acidimicrobiales bacterium]